MAVALLAASCTKPEGEKAEITEAQDAAALVGGTYVADTAASIVNWSGAKPGTVHTGTINVAEGTFAVTDGNITGGSFLIDMNSIVDTDLEGDYKAGLEAHLKGTATGKEDDFFNVAKYPTSKFEITSVTAIEGDSVNTHEIAGNLTLKDITKNVTFKANVSSNDDGTITATSEQFTIDRTEWDIKFMATVIGFPADKAVAPEIGLQINLVAKAAPATTSEAPAAGE